MKLLSLVLVTDFGSRSYLQCRMEAYTATGISMIQRVDLPSNSIIT